jgi:hypothetical protein
MAVEGSQKEPGRTRSRRLASRAWPTPAEAAAFLITIPLLAPLPLHGDARGIADFDPDAARTGSIGTVNSLGNDTLGAKLTSVRKDGKPILGEVFVQQDAGLDATQEARQRCLSVKEGALAQILAVVLDQVEGIEYRGMGSRSPL